MGPDDDTFRYLSLTYSKTHFNMSTSSCGGSGFTDGITNGAEWYPVYGKYKSDETSITIFLRL